MLKKNFLRVLYGKSSSALPCNKAQLLKFYFLQQFHIGNTSIRIKLLTNYILKKYLDKTRKEESP